MTDYVLISTISHFRLNYAIPKEDFAKLGYKEPINTEKLSNYIHEGNVREVSQTHIGENVIEVREYSEDDMLKKFDELNSYLVDWTREHKLNYLNTWQESLDEE